MKIKVLHLIDQYKIGGPGKTIINTARFVDNDIYEIQLATFLPSGNESTELYKKAIAEKIPVLYLKDIRGISINNIKILNRYLRRNKISIISCHGYKSEFYAYLLKCIYSTPIYIVTYHGWIINNFSQKAIVKTTKILSFLHDGIITVSDDILKKLPKTTKLWTKCKVIHNAIVLEDYLPKNFRDQVRKNYGLNEKDFVVGFIGRMSHEKGCFDAIDCIAKMIPQRKNIRLMMVGDGPLKEKLIQYVKTRKLENEVIFTGHVNPVLPYLEVLDMILSASYTEGISNVILEAMALRKPVVATAVGGTPEIIKHGFNGLLVAPHDSNALKNAIEQILADEKLKERIVEASYQRIVEEHDFKERTRKVLGFYNELIRMKQTNKKRNKIKLLIQAFSN